MALAARVWGSVRASRARKLRQRAHADMLGMPLSIVLLPLLFFLARQFSPQGEITCCAYTDLTLPGALHGAPLDTRPVVTISPSGIRVERRLVPVTGVGDELHAARRAHAVLYPGEPALHALDIQADVATNFGEVRAVMREARAAGFDQLGFLVQAR